MSAYHNKVKAKAYITIAALKYIKQRILNVLKMPTPVSTADFMALIEIRRAIEVIYKNGLLVLFENLGPRDQIEIVSLAIKRLESVIAFEDIESEW